MARSTRQFLLPVFTAVRPSYPNEWTSVQVPLEVLSYFSFTPTLEKMLVDAHLLKIYGYSFDNKFSQDCNKKCQHSRLKSCLRLPKLAKSPKTNYFTTRTVHVYMLMTLVYKAKLLCKETKMDFFPFLIHDVSWWKSFEDISHRCSLILAV